MSLTAQSCQSLSPTNSTMSQEYMLHSAGGRGSLLGKITCVPLPSSKPSQPRCTYSDLCQQFSWQKYKWRLERQINAWKGDRILVALLPAIPPPSQSESVLRPALNLCSILPNDSLSPKPCADLATSGLPYRRLQLTACGWSQSALNGMPPFVTACATRILISAAQDPHRIGL